MWKNAVELDMATDDWRMILACRIPKATNAHT